jgi:hypothetical protein
MANLIMTSLSIRCKQSFSSNALNPIELTTVQQSIQTRAIPARITFWTLDETQQSSSLLLDGYD